MSLRSSKSYLRIVAFVEVGQQQGDEHRALLLVADKPTDPDRGKVTHEKEFDET